MKTTTRLALLSATVLGLSLFAAADGLAATAGGSGQDTAGAAAGWGQANPVRPEEPQHLRDVRDEPAQDARGQAPSLQRRVWRVRGLTGVPYDTLACKNCHDPLNLTTPVPYEPSCFDCHRDTDQDADTNAFNDKVPEATCLGCHSRQNAEKSMLTDVHRTLGMVCMDCHSKQEMHGDGTAYESLQEPGALKVSCTQAGCHNTGDLTTQIGKGKGKGKNRAQVGVSARAVEFHAQHLATTDCSACHVQSVLACDSCHFDSEVVGKKRYYRQIPQTGFKFLMNKDGKVRTATYQALTWGSSDPAIDDVSFYVLEPYVAHSIGDGTGTGTGPKVTCEDCHVYVAKKGGSFERKRRPDQLPDDGQHHCEQMGARDGGRWQPDTYREAVRASRDHPGAAGLGDGAAVRLREVDEVPDATVDKDSKAQYWDFLKSGADMVHMPYGSPLSADRSRS